MKVSVSVYASVEIDENDLHARMEEQSISEEHAKFAIALESFHPAEAVDVRELTLI